LPNRFISGDRTSILDNPQRADGPSSPVSMQNTPTTPGHVFVTTNLGQSWSNVSGNSAGCASNAR
jgi:hypothetical protein